MAPKANGVQVRTHAHCRTLFVSPASYWRVERQIPLGITCIQGINVIPDGPMIVKAATSIVALTIRWRWVTLGFVAMFRLLVRTLLVLAIGAIALIAITGAFLADASIMARQRSRRRNPTPIERNPREVGQSKIVLVEEIAS